jgi:hypothetical protein
VFQCANAVDDTFHVLDFPDTLNAPTQSGATPLDEVITNWHKRLVYVIGLSFVAGVCFGYSAGRIHTLLETLPLGHSHFEGPFVNQPTVGGDVVGDSVGNPDLPAFQEDSG